MATTYIFAIGGTGARVLRSFAMLLAAGCKGTSNQEEIVPIIIDYDLENGSTEETQKILQCYQRIHNQAFRPDNSGSNFTPYNDGKKAVTETFFCAPVQRLKDLGEYNRRNFKGDRFEIHLEPNDVRKSFAEHIGFSTINEVNGTQPTRYLLEALYDTSDGVNAELELSLDKGFKGCPNIGCVVTRNLTKRDEIDQLINTLLPNDRVLIIGSIFGGTGASGIPMLLDLLTSQQDDGAGHRCPIGVIAVEPYFKVTSSSDSVINSDTFVAKTKAALMAYNRGNSVNRQADSIYYVGDDKSSIAFPNFEGGREQRNPAHLVELISAICAMHFLRTDFAARGFGDKASFFESWMYFKDHGAGYEEAEDKEKEKLVVKITPDDFPDELMKDYIEPIFKLALFNQFCKNRFLGRGEGERNEVWLRNTSLKDNSEFRQNLREFIDAFERWITELKGKHRTVDIINLDDSKYEHLFVERIMVKKKYMVLNDTIVKDTDISEELGGKYNKFAQDPALKNLVSGKYAPAYFLMWMEEILTDKYAEILKVTQAANQQSK